MNKKWIIIIAAAIMALVILPLGIILSIHFTHFDCSFEYNKVNNILQEIANKHTYYSAKEKAVEIQVDQDTLNSIIQDSIDAMNLELPDKFTIKKVMFDTKKQKIYLNAKYGILNIPLSANIHVNTLNDGVEVFADTLKIAWMGAPWFVRNQIPEDSLKYSLKYEDMDIPQIFSIDTVKFSTGLVKAVVKLDEKNITKLAIDYRKDTLKEVNSFKANNSEFIGTFIDRLLEGGILSDRKIEEYVKSVLDNEELINSAIHFAVADNLDRYTQTLEDNRKKVEEWAKPLTTVKYYGSIEDTVDNILNNKELKEFATWFVPSNKLQEYTKTTEDYYSKYTGAKTSLNTISASIEAGKLEEALDVIVNNNTQIKQFLALFVPEANINEYLTTVEDYYTQYNDAKSALDGAVEKINTDSLNEYIDMTLEYAETLKNERGYLLDSVSMINPDEIRELVAYLEQDSGLAGTYIHGSDPDIYSEFKASLNDLEQLKSDLHDLLEDTDSKTIDNYISALKELKRIAATLKDKEYVKAVDILSKGNIKALAAVE